MTATARDRRDRLRAMLADLKMPGALEAVDGVLAKVDRGAVTAGEAIEQVLGAQIALRNNRRLQAALRSSRLPAVKTLAQFDFTFQPSLKREQIESLHELGFLDRRENVILLGPPGVGKRRAPDSRKRVVRLTAAVNALNGRYGRTLIGYGQCGEPGGYVAWCRSVRAISDASSTSTSSITTANGIIRDARISYLSEHRRPSV